MAEEAVATDDAASDEEEEREPAPRDDAADDTEEDPATLERSTPRWAIRGAVVGAIAGAAAGAGVGTLLARRPDALDHARGALGGSGKHVARAAAGAATEVVASRSLNVLLAGEGDGDRSQLVKQAAGAAGAAAARAARDVIIETRGTSTG